MKSALQFFINAIAVPSSSKDIVNSKGNKSVWFGPSCTCTSFSSKFKKRVFLGGEGEIYGYLLRKSVSICDKLLSQLIGTKPVDGLRLSRSL